MKKILMTLTLLVAMAVSAVAANYVTVTGTSVRLRMKPSMQSETLTNAKGENIHPKAFTDVDINFTDFTSSNHPDGFVM